MKPSFAADVMGFGEPDLDANSALNELDKGLRSVKVGDQCEAIVRFPALFERYPFPILINSAFLKLADVFRTGSNFLRLWVLRVCQQSERHLDKILNTEEFIKKIFSVMHSNDPIARALSLRALGSLSGLIPERKSVHHSIRVALDSNDRVEVSAAIYAASCFAQRSKTFGTTMCTKISTMVQMLSTPLDLKLRLIPIFQHMHHDAETASTVRKLCQELLLSYPSENFVTTILQTLTRLAIAAISDLTEQVAFLLKHLEDYRQNVKLSVLQDLKLLGEAGGHLWDSTHVSILINSLLGYYSDRMDVDQNEDMDTKIIYTTLDVVNSLTSSSAILNFVNSEETPLWNLLETSTHSNDIRIVLKAIQIGTSITVNIKSSDDLISSAGTRLIGLIKAGTETLLSRLCAINAATTMRHDDQLKYLQKCLIHGTLMSRASPYFCDWFCETLGDLIQIQELAGPKRNLMCQALGNIGKFNLDNVRKIVPSLIQMLNRWEEVQLQEENNTVTVLVAIILHAHQNYYLDSPVKEFLKKMIVSSNLWIAYRIARSCFRYGQPEIAALALDDAASKVCSENFFFWLSALHSIALGESILSNQEIPLLQNRLMQATNIYLQAVTSLKAASSPTTTLDFQIEFVRLRCEMLVSFRGFFISCGNLQFSPPPAIAPSASSGANKDSLMASGRVVSQLRKSAREFYALGEGYGRLYQTAFDSDNDSLLTVRILQQVCQLVGRAIEKLVIPKEHASGGTGDLAFMFCFEPDLMECSNSSPLIESCKRVVNLARTVHEFSFEKGITQQHIDCLKEAFRILTETPITYPRFFFQTLQTTRVKMAVSPNPRSPGEPITVIMGNHLALKVEGVIEQTFSGMKMSQEVSVSSSRSHSQFQCFRKPKTIRITVISNPVQNMRSHQMDMGKGNTEPLMVYKDVLPHRDFFTAQFLLGNWTSGIKNLSVESSIIDNEEQQWITGPKTTLSIKVLDEVTTKGQGQSSSSAPGTATASSSRTPTPGLATTLPSSQQQSQAGPSKSKPTNTAH